MKSREFLADPTTEIERLAEDDLRDFVKDLAVAATEKCPNLPEQPLLPDWRLEFEDPQIQREYEQVRARFDRIGADEKIIKDPQSRLLAFWQRNATAPTKSGDPAGAWANRDLGMIAWDKLTSAALDEDARAILNNYMRALEILASRPWKLTAQRTLSAYGLERYEDAGGNIELLSMLASVSGAPEVQSFRLRVKRELKSGAIRRATPAEVAAAEEFLQKLD